MRTHHHLRIYLCLKLLTIFVLLRPIAGLGQIEHGLGNTLLLAKAQEVPGTVTAEVKLPVCPPAGLVPPQSSSPPTRHHQVILTWNASVASTDPERVAVGYCLYRSKKKSAASQNVLCRDCEQVTSIAIAGTSCVDNLVDNDATYHYVVTAINYKGRLSSSSNEIQAQIPAGQQAIPDSPSPLPLCRTSPERLHP